MKWLFLLLFSWVSVASFEAELLAGSQRRSAQPPEYFKEFEAREDEGNLTRVVLRNGLTILIEEQPLEALATVVTYIRAGYSQEEEANRGVSHLLERLYLYRSEVVSEMISLGALLNVTTNYDGTLISSTGAAESVSQTLELHAGLLQAPQIDPQGIALEVEFLQAERLLQLDSPGVFAKQKLLELVYPEEGPGGLLSGGRSFSGLAEMDSTLEQVARFHENYYHPENVILAVSGAVRRERILEKVVELYSPMKSPKKDGQDSEEPASREPGGGTTSFSYLHLRGNHQQPYFLFAYRIPGLEHDDYFPLLVLSYILGRGRGALLQQSMVEEDDSAVEVVVEVEPFQQGGTFLFSVTPNLEKVDRAEVQVLAQLEALKRRGISIEQLDRAKALLLRDHYQGLQSLEQRANSLARHEALGNYLERDGIVELLIQITPERVSQVLERYFTDPNLSLLEYFPQNAESRTFTPESILETLRLLVSSVLHEQADATDELLVAETESSFQPPEFSPNYLKYNLKRTSVLRGPIIYFKEEHVLPLVHLGLFYPGGRIEESAQNFGITDLLLRALLRNAVSGDDSMSFTELERLGAEIKLVNENDFFGFQATALSPHLEKVLGTLIDWTREAAVEEEDLTWARKEVLALLAREKENRFFHLLDLTRTRLFQKHPYGVSRYGTRQSVSGLTLESIQDWLESHMTRVHPFILIRGDIEGTSFLREFVSILSNVMYDSGVPVEREIWEEDDQSTSSGELIFEEHNGEMVMAFRGPARGTRQEAALDVLEGALLSPGGPLWDSLRNQGLAYRLKMFHETGRNGGAIFTSFATLPGKGEAARHDFLKQLSQLEQVPLAQTEFLNAVVGAITRFHIRQQSGESYILELGHNILAKEGVDSMQQYPFTLQNLRREEVMSVAREFFGRENPESSIQNPEDEGEQ
ncbi:MAG: insulinase family protein [Acidobacteria bacterium]|nr:insulinase family protein [Acidobacteriota bacterium]